MKRKFAEWALYLLLVEMILGVLFLSYDKNGWTFACNALFFLLSLVLIPFLHEFGHYVLGKRMGLTFYSLSVAGFTLQSEGGKRTLSFTPARVAGECKMFPVDKTDVERKLLWFTVGGTLFNGVYILLAATVVLLFPAHWVIAGIGMTLPYAIYLFLFNLLPFETFDGTLIYGLLRKDPSAQTTANIFAFQGLLFRGLTPAEAGKDLLFDLPQLPEDDPVFALLQYLRYLFFLDMGATNEAIRAICRLEAESVYVPYSLERRVCVELAYTYSVLTPSKGLATTHALNAFAFFHKHHNHEPLFPADKRAALAYALAFRNEPVYLEWQDKPTKKEELPGLQLLEERLFKELLKDYLKDIDSPSEKWYN